MGVSDRGVQVGGNLALRVSHSKTAEGCTDDPKSPDLDSRLAHRALLPLVGVGIVIVGLVSANIWWLLTNRRGLPPNIDEAGYLQRTVQFGQDLSNHGISGIVHYWTTPDTTGPLLIAVSGTIRSATGLNAFGLLCTEQIPFAATIVGAYLLARQICGRWMALACATLVACMPGLLDAGRLYILAEPATALFILLVVAQLRAGRFDSIWRTLLWGLLVGLTALTRTMMIAVLVGPVVGRGIALDHVTTEPSPDPQPRGRCRASARRCRQLVLVQLEHRLYVSHAIRLRRGSEELWSWAPDFELGVVAQPAEQSREPGLVLPPALCISGCAFAAGVTVTKPGSFVHQASARCSKRGARRNRPEGKNHRSGKFVVVASQGARQFQSGVELSRSPCRTNRRDFGGLVSRTLKFPEWRLVF